MTFALVKKHSQKLSFFLEATIQARSNSECVQFSCDVTQNNTYLFCRQQKSQQTNSSRNMEEKLAKVNSKAEFRDFIDEHVRWNISIFVDKSNEACSQATKHENFYKLNVTSNSQPHPQCYIKANIFEATDCFCNYTADEEKRKLLRKASSVFMILGVISLIGNITVIFIEVRALIQKHSVATEKTIFRVLILNLSISDLLMGFYITFFPIALQFDGLLESNEIPELCNFFGVISVLSSEISVTVLVLICVYRWVGIVYPYKRVRLKVLKNVISIMWIVWLIVALIPALSVDLIGLIFKDGVQFSDDPKHDIIFNRALELFKHISSGLSTNNVSQVIPVLGKLVRYDNRDLLHTLLNNSGILQYNDFNYFGYYSYYYSCTLRTFITTPFSDQYYTLLILLYNFLAFIFISVACIVIYKHAAKNAKIVEQNGQTVNEQKLSENNEILRRLLFVIVTDFLCWIPICVTAFYFYLENSYHSFGQSSQRKNCKTKFSIFVDMSFAVLALMPINSVINPYLYSWRVWKQFLKKCKSFVCKKLT